MAETFFDKVDEMLNGPPDSTGPYKKGERIESGEVAKKWTGPTQKELRRRSTGGSPSFSDAELKQGYRKVK